MNKSINNLTSLTFILICVPLPVCQTTSGKCASNFPSTTSEAAVTIFCELINQSKLQYLGNLVRQTEFLIDLRGSLLENAKRVNDGELQIYQSINKINNPTGILSDSPPILKFMVDLIVCAP